MALRVFYPDTPALPLPPGHRFPAAKYALLREAVIAGGILEPAWLVPCPLATATELELAHDAAYVAAALSDRLPPAILHSIGLPWSPVLKTRALATVGGTLAAAQVALAHGISGQLAGGTHHAHRDRGAGFCVFNDCAVAALALLDRGQIARAAILDLDVHQGDGTAAILADDPRAFVVSVHGANNYPFEKATSGLDIALPDGTEDGPYLEACETALKAVNAFAPGLVFYIAGVDPLASDRLGRLAVSSGGLMARDDRVMTACRHAGIPVVILIGGGYAEPISDTVNAYANTFRAARAVWRL